MKLKLLLLLMLPFFVSNAQDTIRSLVITEARMDYPKDAYIEISNMGDKPVQLSNIKFGQIGPWNTPINNLWSDPWDPGYTYFFLPEKVLQPKEQFVITLAYDHGPRKYANHIVNFESREREKINDIYEIADLLIHLAEPDGDATDSVTTTINAPRGGVDFPGVLNVFYGRSCWYLEQHFDNGDSLVIEQVGGVFDNNGKNQPWGDPSVAGYDVAGIARATATSILIRKHKVTTGNLDFANARGVGKDDSEWIPIEIPNGYDKWRTLWWTVGNHGDNKLDANTLESDLINVNFSSKTLTVPWGIRRLDDIMHHMKKKPGIAWDYHLNEFYEDSLYCSARTGDKLTIYVCGNELQTATFDIIVSEPSPDVNIVVPIDHKNPEGAVTTRTQNGILNWPRVTQHESGIDTITGTWFGIPYATRTDTLMKYLEKPTNASWEFVWVDGVVRPNLKNGDKLKVTAQNGDVKEYFIQIQAYDASHNAYLSSITWPDIPKFYWGLYGWMGDTIPSFNSLIFNYRIQVPKDVEGIPAMVFKTQDLNANVVVKRATSLSGTLQDRTISFTVTAEDNIVTNTYNIELIKEKDTSKEQPYYAEPFLSEFVFKDQYANSFAEIVNPGNRPLDLSNYMIVMYSSTDPATVIASRMDPEKDWMDRYDKYVPGYKWLNQTDWVITPGILEQDLNVNTIVQPGDVFCMGDIKAEYPGWYAPLKWLAPEEMDVQFNNFNNKIKNPWGEPISYNGTPVGKWSNASWYMFKILNDSIKLGLKPANDPNDFKLIEVISMGDGSSWKVDGVNVIGNTTGFVRKPDIYKANSNFKGSFGTDPGNSEWIFRNLATWTSQGLSWGNAIWALTSDLGQHFMNEPTHYKSTVTSVVYKVSEGYSMEEEIKGMTTGTTVGTFLSNLNKANEKQSLTVKSAADGSELELDDQLSLNDILVVLSADSTNTTKYILDVSEEGLSSDAILTSSLYDITIESEPTKAGNEENTGSGIISGIEYGTSLHTVVSNLTVPPGATMNIIDGEGGYVPFKMLNFDTTYVNVTVNAGIYFEVVAENGITRIVYELQPSSSQNDAFILSDYYMISQNMNLIQYVPGGINVQKFISYLVPSVGATLKMVDKMGLEKVEGTLYEDDKVVVTSSNGLVSKVYHLSMLPTKYILQTTYLAYVLSDIYAIDQINYMISGPSGSTLLSEFYSKITPSMGATAIVVNANGVAQTSGDLDDGDKLMVTSADGKIVVMYELDLNLTSINPINNIQFELYPNPTNAKINITGVEAGNRIQVYNSVGAIVCNLNVQNKMEVIDLDNQPSGMYLIVISDKNKMLGRFKALKQ